MKILVTGGAGYIGSHTVLGLLQKNYEVVAVDNFDNSSPESLKRVEKLAGKQIAVHNFDVRDRERLEALFAAEHFDAVIHFAGLKAVGESVAKPLQYYDNNLVSTLVLCETMQEHGVKQLVFSSSATIYGDPARVPITEDMPVQPTNPYGHTKAMIEQILRDLTASKNGWQISLLRYFNPVGAHESGQIGEDPNGTPNNLLPYIAQVAVGKLAQLSVFGNDYETPDGTGVRDYIHVVDLAAGHVAALEHMPPSDSSAVYNLATGKGTSVFEAIVAFEQVSGKKIPYRIAARRPGDIAVCYADPSKAERELGWRANLTFEQACADAWRWQSMNPNGFGS